MSIFGNCLGQRAEAYAPQNAEPSDIANAAVSDCDAQLNAYRTATLDHFKTLLPRDPKLARSYSDRLTNETREKGRKAVISKVLQLRTK